MYGLYQFGPCHECEQWQYSVFVFWNQCVLVSTEFMDKITGNYHASRNVLAQRLKCYIAIVYICTG